MARIRKINCCTLRIITFCSCLISFAIDSVVAQAPSQKLYAGVVSLADSIGGDALAGAGVYVSELSAPTWEPLSWAQSANAAFGIPVRALAMAEAPDLASILVGSDDGVLAPLGNFSGWKILTDWRVRDVLDLFVDPINPQNVYAATGLGVAVSQDGGKTWEMSNRGLKETFVSCLASDPLKPGRILAGTENGVYESIDHARTWRTLALENVAIRSILQQPSSPGVYWLGTEYHGLLASQDGGYVFTPVPLGQDSLSIYSVAGGNLDEPLLAGSFERGVFMAADDELIWRHLEGSEQLGTIFSIALADSGRSMYFGTQSRGVWRSTDSGANWERFGLEGADVRKLLPATIILKP